MGAEQLAEEIKTLPEPAQAAIERLVMVLKHQYAASTVMRTPPVLYVADSAQEGNPFMDPEFYGAWANRTDITDSAEYIHQVRRGLRPAR